MTAVKRHTSAKSVGYAYAQIWDDDPNERLDGGLERGKRTATPRDGHRDPLLRVCKVGRICRGRFLYLVQGKDQPQSFWRKVGERFDSSLIWLSWGSREGTARRSESNHFTFLHLPNTTFNSGRNHLWKVGKQLEKKQGWQFEYFVFCDEDMSKLIIDKDEDSVANLSRERPRSISLLNYLLLRHRPARAGIHLGNKAPVENSTCRIAWSIDICVEAVHRTVLDAMLPYSEKFDKANIWVSALLQNLKALTFLPRQALEFRQIRRDELHQNHAKYPRLGGSGWRTKSRVWKYLISCLPPQALAARNLINTSVRALTSPIQAALSREGSSEPCPYGSEKADYAYLVRDVASEWVSEYDSCGAEFGRPDYKFL